MKRKLLKIIHLATAIDRKGNASALCFGQPHAIDMHREYWTSCHQKVTCEKCLTILRNRAPALTIEHVSAEAPQ